ncbi:hypothetical protein [Pyrodictium delaneyi]|uniref:hypothetical protein n=1 Tax=Pyrodictium delaneyi TaxID=1273541 RepID=UPI0012E2A18E|nr:hypothetical protein [Pyrodictium delaneyi]
MADEECQVIDGAIVELCKEARRRCIEEDDDDACAFWRFDCHIVRECLKLRERGVTCRAGR